MKTSKFRMPSYDISGKVAVVTEAKNDIGHAIAVTLANFGADIVISSSTAADCEQTVKEIEAMGRRCIGVAADVTVKEDVDNLISTAVRTFGKIDILVNNAETGGKAASIFDQTEEDWDRVMNKNLKGVFLCGKAAAEAMKSSGGRIINISSVAGRTGQKDIAPYVASKSGVLGLTRTMANELACYGITVNAVCPGYAMTDISSEIVTKQDVRERILEVCPLGRYGTVEEIVAPVAFLASDSCRFITGTYLVADGGFLTEAPIH